jgi:putative DNA primase/helicase
MTSVVDISIPFRSIEKQVTDCPACGYRNAFSVTHRDGRTLFKCHVGCSQEAVLAAVRVSGDWKANQTREPKRKGDRSTADSRKAAIDIWRRAAPGAGTPVDLYLRLRALRLKPWPSDLRFIAKLTHKPTGNTYPAMIAAVRDVEGTIIGVHRTYLAVDARGKAPVTPAKMSLGPIGGGAVRFAPVGPHLLIGEGIESTLSAMLSSGVPGWAGLSAGGIRGMALPPVPNAATVTIVADRDPVGIAAAEDAAARWTLEGRVVRVAVPPNGYDDWNDCLQAGEVTDVRG